MQNCLIMSAINLNNILSKEIAEGYFAKLIHTDKMTFSFVEAKAGKVLKEHSHPHEQVSIMLEGKFQLTLNGEVIVFTKDEVIIIPSNAKHSGLAITNCKLLDVFYPVREEYKKL